MTTPLERPAVAPSSKHQLEGERQPSVAARFEQAARQFPGRSAVRGAGLELTYEALNAAANRVAGAILQRCGLAEEPAVVLLGQGPPQIAAMLGALKAGKTCVPLDPASSLERLTAALQEARPGVILTGSAFALLAEEGSRRTVPVLDLDRLGPVTATADTDLRVAPDRPAYVLFTTDAQGQPRRVTYSHGGLVHLAARFAAGVDLSPGDRVALLTSCDVAGAEATLLAALLAGAAVLPFPLLQLGPHALVQFLAQEGVTVLPTGPTVFRLCARALDESSPPANLRQIRLGGGPVLAADAALCQRFGPRCRLTVALDLPGMPAVAHYRADPGASTDEPRIPVGHAAEGIELHIIGPDGTPVGVDQAGEVVIRSEFLPLECADDDGRELRTGELGRWRADGCLVHLGRPEEHVTLRERTVDVAEVENALLELPQVKAAIVVGHQDKLGSSVLAAYVVPALKPPPQARDLRAALAGRLPEGLVPPTLVLTDELPVRADGEVDRRALPQPNVVRPAQKHAYVAPTDPLQNLLVELWEKNLDLRPVGVRDNFFELGGDSLLAAEMLQDAEDLLGREVPADVLLAGATVEHLAAALASLKPADGRAHVVEVQPGPPEHRLFLLHGDYNGGGFYCVNLAHRLGRGRPLYALPPHGAFGPLVPATVEQMAAEQLEALLAFQPRGPYRLAGHCNGALVAYEMARQLDLRGERVELLALISPGFTAAAPAASASSTPPADVSQVPRENRRKVLDDLYYKATAGYFPRPFPGQLTVLYPVGELAAPYVKFNWRTVARDVDVRLLPGAHLTVLSDHVATLARHLSECLDAASAAAQSR